MSLLNISKTDTWLDVTVKHMLQDRVYRKLNEWPLVSINDIDMYSYPKDKSITAYDACKRKKIMNTTIECPFINMILQFNKYEKSGIVVAGGSICDIILNNKINDIDIFFYGLEEECTIIYNDLVSMFESKDNSLQRICDQDKSSQYVYDQKHIRNQDKSSKYDYDQNKTSYLHNIYLHIYSDYEKKIKHFQFIKKIFPTKSSIIGRFDLPSSSVLYDGIDILMTPMAAYTFATETIYVESMKRSAEYEYRISKYIEKGFGIAIPEVYIVKKFCWRDLINNEYSRGNSFGYVITCNSNFLSILETYSTNLLEKVPFSVNNKKKIYMSRINLHRQP